MDTTASVHVEADLKSSDHDMTIGEVARHAGVQPSAIRYYESIALLPEPIRISGRRRYEETVLRQLGTVTAAQQAGLSLDEIRGLLDASRAGTPIGSELRALAQNKLPEVEQLIDRAQQTKRWFEAASTCHCITLGDCPLVAPAART